MNPQVLILSSVHDFSTDLVATHFEDKSVPFVRLNREYLPEYRLVANPEVPYLSIHGGGIEAKITSALKSVWFRQPVFLRNIPVRELSPAEQLARTQWSAFLRSLALFDSAAWMNWPQATYLAESKPYQLMVARRCGFRIPKTLVGNNAADFQKMHCDDLVFKSLDTAFLLDGDDCLFAYTNNIAVDDFSDENTAAVPMMVQERIEDKTDIRVTVVGRVAFAVRILSDGERIAGDWRTTPKEKLEYQPFELPPAVNESCLSLAKRLGLSFAAIDLLESPRGYFFLEVNPTGEWAWLANEQPLDVAIAKWLVEPTK